MPWFEPLYNEQMPLVDGDLMIPDRPGLGFSLNPYAVERFRIED